MFVHLTHLVLSSATLSNEIFCGSFLTKNLVICVPTTLAKQILFHNPINKNLVGGKHHVLIHYMEATAPNQKRVFLWRHLNERFLGAFCLKKSQEQKSGRRATQCSHILCGGCCTRPKESSPLQLFQLRYFVVCTHTF